MRTTIPAPCPRCGGPTRDGTCVACGDDEDPRVGLVLDGKYRVESLLGRGGMGRVYRATQLALGEPVAIKFLLSVWASSAELRARFRREAVALARLRHPNTAWVLDFGEHEGEPYIAMELIDGEQLAARIAAPEPLGLPTIGRVFDQLLQVIEAAHAQGIVHRDLKPENVMIVRTQDRSLRIKVLDFGLAYVDEGEHAPRLTETGRTHGTPYYMSPEQCRGREVGSPTDIYAIGVMLFEALTGVVPFDGEDAASIMAKQMFVDAPEMSSVGIKREIPPGVVEVVKGAMRKRPAERPSASELRDQLDRAMRGTDAATIAAAAALARANAAGLSRGERALTGRHAKKVESDASATPGARVALCVRGADTLRDALAVRGVPATIASLDDALAREEPWAAIVVEGDAASIARVREDARHRGAPVLFLRAPSRAMTELVRAGASDVCSLDAQDEDVCRKVQRLIRRRR